LKNNCDNSTFQLFLVVTLLLIVMDILLGYLLYDFIIGVIHCDAGFLNTFHHVICFAMVLAIKRSGFAQEVAMAGLIAEVHFFEILFLSFPIF
jgi:hypothetical protein